MYYAQGGLGGSPEKNTGAERVERLAPQPNPFYQEKVLLFLAGKIEAFKETTLSANLVEGTQRNELLKGIAAGKYNLAIQMMLANEMKPIKGMTTEQMRQICIDQVEFLRQEGHVRLKNDRFLDAATDIHATLDRLREPAASGSPTTDSKQTMMAGTPVLPLEASDRGSFFNAREFTVDPELETKITLKQFLQAQLVIMGSKLSTMTDIQSQQYFQTSARINLVNRCIATLNSGMPFSKTDAPLLMYFINETRTSESARLARAQSKIGNETEQSSIAQSLQKLWQIQKYVEIHQEKPVN